MLSAPSLGCGIARRPKSSRRGKSLRARSRPRGNTVNRASIDGKAARDRVPEILVTHLMEGIGIALDLRGDRMFMTDLAGSLYTAKLDGSEKRALLIAQGNLTGIAFAQMPQQEK
jgi:hypothetical protein